MITLNPAELAALPPVAALIEALRDAREAIASLPDDALGIARDHFTVWPIRDELLSKIDAALAQFIAEQERGEGE